MTWFLTALSLAGAILVARKNRYAFLLWIFANVGWCAVACWRGDWPQVVLWGSYLVTAIDGWVRWKE